MSPTNLTRRSFMKASALAAGAAALGSGVATVNNLVESDQAYAADEVKLVHTSCRACISNCGIIAHVQNGRVIKLEGDPADPMSEGRVCPKGLSGIQALYHPNRNKYPMKRVGERGGNQWERISWEEAIDTIADALMDMKDKTGLEGLLCSTGGGGNPQFFSPPRFRNFWGAGNVFEPGCAQCYLPRNYTMPLINGVSDTSIADSGCAELYNPTVSIDTYVMWGTGPAQHAPSSAGRAVVELRAAGTKTVVIDPRYTPDAARADVVAGSPRHRRCHDAGLDALHYRQEALQRGVLLQVDQSALPGGPERPGRRALACQQGVCRRHRRERGLCLLR